MWYVKKVAQKVTNLTQNVLRQKSKVQKQFEEVISNSNKVMPIRKMSDLAESSYEIEKFEEIVKVVAEKLKQIKFERKSLKKRLNVLVLVVYLIKHGASGFIDQFRAMISETFQRYENIANFLAQQDAQKRSLMNQIKDRAKYIIILLTDKATLLKQKEMSRLIREKIYLQKEQINGSKEYKDVQTGSKQDKIQSLLEHYVWRYTNKIDRKLDKLTDVLIAKIDEYLDGDMPDDFEIDEAEIQNTPSTTKSQFQLSGESERYKQSHFIRSKLQIKQSDLLQFPASQISQSEPVPAVKEQLASSQQCKINLEQNTSQVIGSEQEALKELRIKQFQAMDDLQIQKFRNELIETAAIPISLDNQIIKQQGIQQIEADKPQEAIK